MDENENPALVTSGAAALILNAPAVAPEGATLEEQLKAREEEARSAPDEEVGRSAQAVIDSESRALRLEEMLADAFGDAEGNRMSREVEADPTRYVGDERRVVSQLALALIALARSKAAYLRIVEEKKTPEELLAAALVRLEELAGADEQLRVAQDVFTRAAMDTEALRKREALLVAGHKRQSQRIAELEDEASWLREQLASSEVRVRSLEPAGVAYAPLLTLSGHAGLDGSYARRGAAFLREGAIDAAWGGEQWLARDGAGYWVVSGSISCEQGGWIKSVARGALSPIGLQYEACVEGKWALDAELSVRASTTATEVQISVDLPLPRD